MLGVGLLLCCLEGLGESARSGAVFDFGCSRSWEWVSRRHQENLNASLGGEITEKTGACCSKSFPSAFICKTAGIPPIARRTDKDVLATAIFASTSQP